MKIKSLIIAALCTVSVMCFSAEFNFTGDAIKDLTRYTRSHGNEIKTFSDIKNLVAEYKAKYPNVKNPAGSTIAVAYLTVARTNKTVYQEALAECENLKTLQKTNVYWNNKFHLIFYAGKNNITNTEYFKGITECLVTGDLSKSYFPRAIEALIKNDINVDRELKIKCYQQIFEKYYVELAETTNKEHYNAMKTALSKVGLKLKSLGIDVK